MINSIVIIDDYASITGGASSVAINSAIYLANNTDYDVYYFAAVGPVSIDLTNANFAKVICLNQSDILNNSSRIKAIYKGLYNRNSAKKLEETLTILDKNRTIVHVHTWTKSLSSSIFKTLGRLESKVVITLHDYFISCPNGGLFNYKKNTVCELNPLSLKCIISNCDSRSYGIKLWRVIRQFIQNHNLKKISNIHFINVSTFSKIQLIKHNLSLKNDILIDNPVSFDKCEKVDANKNEYFLFLGRLSEEKGVRMFCDIVTRNKMKGLVIGDGPLKEELEAKYKQSILFKGWLSKENIREYFKKTRVLVFPSLWYETLGLTVLEAMSQGIPSIVPDNCAASDLVQDGISGLIFKSGCEDSLSDKIQEVQDNNLVEYLSKNAYNTFDANKYSTKTHCSSLLSLYQSI